MSVTSDEINYLIWRYLQESGHELSTFALQRETRAHLLDEQFSKHISIGALVSIVQKGIQYMEVEASVREDGEIVSEDRPFTLIGALHMDGQEPDELQDENQVNNSHGLKTDAEQASKNVNQQEVSQQETKDKSNTVTSTRSSNASTTTTISTTTKTDAKVQVSTAALPKPLHDLAAIYQTGPSEAAQWSPTSPSTLVVAQQARSADLLVFPRFYTDSNPDASSAVEPASFVRLVHSALDYGVAEVTAVAWNPLGTLCATAATDGQMRLWTAEGKLRHALLLHRAPVLAVRWNEPSTLILSVDCANTVAVWDAYSGEVRQTFQHGQSPSSSLPTAIPGSSPSLPSAVSNTATTPSLYYPPSSPYDNIIPNGSSTNSNQQALIVSGTMSIGSDACWIDSLTYATTGDNATIVIYKISERGPLLKFRGHTQGINCLQFDSRSQLLASASDDHTVRIWHGKSAAPIATLMGHLAAVISVKWLPPTGILSSLDPAAFGGSFTSSNPNLSTSFSTSTTKISNSISGPNSTSMTNVNSLITNNPPHLLQSSSPPPSSSLSTFRPQTTPAFGGARLASASLDGTIRIWDPTRNLCLAVLSLHESPIFACEVSPNGRLLASGGLDGVLIIWDISTIVDVEQSAILAAKESYKQLYDTYGSVHAIARFELNPSNNTSDNTTGNGDNTCNSKNGTKSSTPTNTSHESIDLKQEKESASNNIEPSAVKSEPVSKSSLVSANSNIISKYTEKETKKSTSKESTNNSSKEPTNDKTKLEPSPNTDTNIDAKSAKPARTKAAADTNNLDNGNAKAAEMNGSNETQPRQSNKRRHSEDGGLGTEIASIKGGKEDQPKPKRIKESEDSPQKRNHINSMAWSCDSTKLCVCYAESSVIIDTSSLVPNIH